MRRVFANAKILKAKAVLLRLQVRLYKHQFA